MTWPEIKRAFLQWFGKSFADYDLAGGYNFNLDRPQDYVTLIQNYLRKFRNNATEAEKVNWLFQGLPHFVKAELVMNMPQNVQDFQERLREVSRMLQYRRQAAQSREATLLLGQGPLNYPQGGHAFNQVPPSDTVYSHTGVHNFPTGPCQRAQLQQPVTNCVPSLSNLPQCPATASSAKQDASIMQQIDTKFEKLTQQINEQSKQANDKFNTLAELMAKQLNSSRGFVGRNVNRSIDANGEQICFGCGQSGHIKRRCPNGGSVPIRIQDSRAAVQQPSQLNASQYVPQRAQQTRFNAYADRGDRSYVDDLPQNLSLN